MSRQELNYRKIDMPRGKVLGGTSAINGMLYVRGQAEDFDNWAGLEIRAGLLKMFFLILKNQ